MEERREYPRKDVRLKISYSLSDAEKKAEEIETTSFNISFGGIGIRLHNFMKAGELRIRIFSSGGSAPIEARGKLVWQGFLSNFGEKRAGVQFTEVPWTRLKTLVA